MKKISSYLPKILLVVLLILFSILLYSALYSGLNYQYDGDELTHSQIVYLLGNGYRPYADFWMVLTPVFHWFLLPLYKITGFNFTALFYARVVMIVFFLCKIIFLSLSVKEIFGKKTALLFTVFMFLDPFSVFSGMQIRPDNFMMAIFAAGLYFLLLGMKKYKSSFLFIGGIFWAIAVITNIKILFVVLASFVVIFLYFHLNRKMRQFVIFIAGFFLPWLIFFGYFLLNGLFAKMIQFAYLDTRFMHGAILNPSTLWYFYKPDNIYIFGFGGKPLTWITALILPLLAFTGIFFSFKELRFFKKPFVFQEAGKYIFFCSFAAQLFWLLNLKSVFVQYFLTVGWYFCLYAALGIVILEKKVEQKSKKLGKIFTIIFFLLLFVFTYGSINANFNRAKIDNQGTYASLNRIWQKIPASSLTFPNLLFRPLSYPLIYGAFLGDTSKEILKRAPPLYEVFEQKKIQYLLLDSYTMIFVDAKTKEYIKANYEKMEEGIYVRKNSNIEIRNPK